MALRYFLACVIVLSSLVSAKPPTYVLLGQEVHLKPVFTGHPDDILWKQDGNKVVEFNGKEEHVYSRYHSRVTLDWVSAELYITDLSHEDSGEYELEIYMNKEMHRFAYKLEVIDKVNKPSVSCDMNSSSSDTSGTWATLTCFAEPTQPLSSLKNEYVYEWESGGNVMPGHQLRILLEDEPDDQIYTCKVRNPLTSETTAFAATTCYPDESSSVALIVSLTILSILLLLLVLAIVFCKLKNKACFAKSNSANVENGRSPTQDGKETDPDDERTHFLHAAPTLPSHQRLRPLVQAHSDNHREHAAADLDKGEESNKEEDEIEDKIQNTFGVKLKPVSLKRALPDPHHQVEGKRRHEEDRSPTSPDQKEMDKTVSGDKHESDREDIEENLNTNTSQSTTPKTTFGVPLKPIRLISALPDPDRQGEGESKHESECEGQLDISAAKEEDDEGKTEEDCPPTSPEQNTPETAPGEHHSKLSEGETQAKEDDQPEINKPVSDRRESDGEEAEDNLYSDTSQSPTPKNTDNTQTNTFEKSPNAALPDPDHQVEGESKQKSESEGQSDSSAAEEEDDEAKTEEERTPTSPEQNISETASCEPHPELSEGETHSKEDDQPEMDKTVSGDECESDGEEPEILCEDTSQSPTPKELSEGETQAKEDDLPEINKTVSGDKRGSDGDETEENLNTDTSQSTTPKTVFGVTLKPICLKSALPVPDRQGEGESKHESECKEQLDSSAAEEEDDEGETEEDRPPTSPEKNMPESASGEHHSKLSEGETHAEEDDQEEMDKTVSGDKRESDGEETEENLYTDTSQSPAPKNTDNTQTSTFEKSPTDALPDPDHQGEVGIKQKSESEGQSDSSAAEEEEDEGKTEEKTKDEFDPKEEKPAGMSESEDKEGEKKTGAVEK